MPKQSVTIIAEASGLPLLGKLYWRRGFQVHHSHLTAAVAVKMLDRMERACWEVIVAPRCAVAVTATAVVLISAHSTLRYLQGSGLAHRH